MEEDPLLMAVKLVLVGAIYFDFELVKPWDFEYSSWF
jgi:hypothetical protein